MTIYIANMPPRDRIRLLRLAHRLTLAQVAGELGIDLSTLARYEGGSRRILEGFEERHAAAVEKLANRNV